MKDNELLHVSVEVVGEFHVLIEESVQAAQRILEVALLPRNKWKHGLYVFFFDLIGVVVVAPQEQGLGKVIVGFVDGFEFSGEFIDHFQ